MPNEEAYIQAIYRRCTEVEAESLLPKGSRSDCVFCALTSKHPAFITLQFEWHQRLPAGWVHLRHIEVYPPCRGYGSELMTHLCQQADDFEISLFLEAVPLRKGQVDIPQTKLISWYQGFGFKQSSKIACSAMERRC